MLACSKQAHVLADQLYGLVAMMKMDLPRFGHRDGFFDPTDAKSPNSICPEEHVNLD